MQSPRRGIKGRGFVTRRRHFILNSNVWRKNVFCPAQVACVVFLFIRASRDTRPLCTLRGHNHHVSTRPWARTCAPRIMVFSSSHGNIPNRMKQKLDILSNPTALFFESNYYFFKYSSRTNNKISFDPAGKLKIVKTIVKRFDWKFISEEEGKKMLVLSVEKRKWMHPSNFRLSPPQHSDFPFLWNSETKRPRANDQVENTQRDIGVLCVGFLWTEDRQKAHRVPPFPHCVPTTLSIAFPPLPSVPTGPAFPASRQSTIDRSTF